MNKHNNIDDVVTQDCSEIVDNIITSLIGHALFKKFGLNNNYSTTIKLHYSPAAESYVRWFYDIPGVQPIVVEVIKTTIAKNVEKVKRKLIKEHRDNIRRNEERWGTEQEHLMKDVLSEARSIAYHHVQDVAEDDAKAVFDAALALSLKPACPTDT